ncbi:MAG: tRNA (adenosine(37)-N6)-threonylcarbamoyltransferase complex dimerization subunit type 1 TsaB [Actinomycetota bacterium]
MVRGKMIILGFDTATPVTSIGLADENRVLADLSLVSEKTQVERLMPLIDLILTQANVTVRDLDGIAVGLGPGLFTSLRIGVTTARTLAQVLKIPIVGVSSLDTLAYSLAHSSALICAVIDAKRREVFSALYEGIEGEIRQVGPEKVVSPEDLIQELSRLEREVILIGDGAWLYRDLFLGKLTGKTEVAPAFFGYPRASNLISLSSPKFLAEPATSRAEDVYKLVPTYIRRSDAEIAYERKRLR